MIILGLQVILDKHCGIVIKGVIPALLCAFKIIQYVRKLQGILGKHKVSFEARNPCVAILEASFLHLDINRVMML